MFITEFEMNNATNDLLYSVFHAVKYFTAFVALHFWQSIYLSDCRTSDCFSFTYNIVNNRCVHYLVQTIPVTRSKHLRMRHMTIYQLKEPTHKV